MLEVLPTTVVVTNGDAVLVVVDVTPLDAVDVDCVVVGIKGFLDNRNA